MVRSQLPLALNDFSEPEPDLAVVPVGGYEDAHPSTAHLIIEVADSSLASDRAKADEYAAASIPEYWIVNLVDGVVEVYTRPVRGRYASTVAHGGGEVLHLQVFADVDLRTDDILGASGGGHR